MGGFTRIPPSGVRHPARSPGSIEKIPYLKDLGVTHVELLPVMAFDEQDVPRGVRRPRAVATTGATARTASIARIPATASNPAEGEREFRELTDALHAAGIGVLLDVVFNHTAEGGALGPMINFKGLANEVFYHLDAADKRRYRDYTGCGNTVNCNHPMVDRLHRELPRVLGRRARRRRFQVRPGERVRARTDGARHGRPAAALGIELSRVARRRGH